VRPLSCCVVRPLMLRRRQEHREIVQRLSDQDDVVAVFCAFPVVASAFLDNDAVYQGELICIDDGSTDRLRAGFIRQIPLKGRPNTLLQTLVDHAACATAVAEAAMLDPAVPHNDKVRLSGEARRSRLELAQAIAAKPVAPLESF
jgi:hypothetical protein